MKAPGRGRALAKVLNGILAVHQVLILQILDHLKKEGWWRAEQKWGAQKHKKKQCLSF